MPDFASILRMRDEEIKNVMKKIIRREQRDGDHRDPQQYRAETHEPFLRCLSLRVDGRLG
jgi:hypothetical protein